MTKLLNSHRDALTAHLIGEVFRGRELRLKQEEHALALRLLREVYGDGSLAKMSELPEGWLPTTSHLNFMVDGRYYHICFSDPARVPAEALRSENIVPSPAWMAAYQTFKDARDGLSAERRALEFEVRGTLVGFTTIEKLAEGWPEGYAHFPHPQLAPTSLPALRIEDLNARITASREAA